MDTGKKNNGNFKYFEGYEGEKAISVESILDSNMKMTIWEGYIEDILEEPEPNEAGWQGFTRDYHEDIGAWSNSGSVIINADEVCEYVDDLRSYCGKNFSYPETSDALNDTINFLQMVEKTKAQIKISLI